MRIVLFGFDGLTFRVLHPLIECCDLRKLCEAVVESKYPPLTPSAWTSLSLGMKPATHGVYDYQEYEEEQHGMAQKAHVQTCRKGAKAIWNILRDGKQYSSSMCH